MNLQTNDSVNVADLVISDPRAAAVFERFGIDYCCHGARPLDEACASANAPVDDVRAALAELGAAPPMVASGPADDIGSLIGFVVGHHHTWLRRELPHLGEQFARVIAAHGEHHPELDATRRTLDEVVDDLLPHLLKEERVLFPLAIELLGAIELPSMHCGSVRNPISVMHLEHDRVGDLLATLRAQTDGYRVPDDACPTWRALWAGLAELESRTHEHIHLENNVLFPKITALEASLG